MRKTVDCDSFLLAADYYLPLLFHTETWVFSETSCQTLID